MANDGEADRSVRIVGANAQADESVFVVNNMVVAGSPSPGDVPMVQGDGSLAWGAGGGAAAVPDSRGSWFANADTAITTTAPIGHLIESSLVGHDMTLDPDGVHIHLTSGQRYIAMASVFVASGGLQGATDVAVAFGVSNGDDWEGSGVDAVSATAHAANLFPTTMVVFAAGDDCVLNIFAYAAGAGAPLNFRGGVDVRRIA